MSVPSTDPCIITLMVDWPSQPVCISVQLTIYRRMVVASRTEANSAGMSMSKARQARGTLRSTLNPVAASLDYGAQFGAALLPRNISGRLPICILYIASFTRNMTWVHTWPTDVSEQNEASGLAPLLVFVLDRPCSSTIDNGNSGSDRICSSSLLWGSTAESWSLASSLLLSSMDLSASWERIEPCLASSISSSSSELYSRWETDLHT